MIHELSTWEEVANEYRHEPAYRLIIRRAEEKIDEFSDADETIEAADIEPNNVDDLIDAYKESEKLIKMICDSLNVERDDLNEERLDAYKAAYSELQELEEVLLDRMDYLTRPVALDQVRHEFDRADELHADEIKRITAERDFYKLLSCR